MSTYRPYERLPAREYGLRFSRKTQQLRDELNQCANDDEPKAASFNPALVAFLVMSGCAFWGEIAVLIWRAVH